MTLSVARFAHGWICVGVLVAAAGAQQPAGTSDSSTLQLLKAPETPAELWDAVKFSLNVGQVQSAARYLDRLLASDPSADLLIQIRERDAGEFFPKLAAAPELQEKAALLIRRADEAARQRATDPERIRKFIGYLARSPEHRAYGIAQLRAAGADAVPYLLGALADPSLSDQHAVILRSMQLLDRSALPPLVAALESDDAGLLSALFSVLRVLGTRDTVPHLTYLAESPGTSEVIQTLARSAIAQIVGRPYGDQPAARELLGREADRYYEGTADLKASSSGTVRLWRWVSREGLRADEVSAGYAREYFGVLHCRRALALDAAYEPAQVTLLSLALERASEQVGADQPLPEGPAQASSYALEAGPDLLRKVLRRALDGGHPRVAVAALRALGQTADRAVLAADAAGPSPLVRALSAPDVRIQFAAAEAALQLAPQEPFPGSTLIPLILARMLQAEGARKALVIDYDTARGSDLASLLREAGYEAQLVTSGREGFPLAAASADYELIFIEPNTQNPELSPTLVLFRSDPRTAGIPILLPGEMAMQIELGKFERRYGNVSFLLRPTQLETLRVQLDRLLARLGSGPLTGAERQEYARRSAAWLSRLARGEIRGVDPRPAEPAILAVLASESLGPDAITAAGRLPGGTPQQALAQLVLADTAAPALRLQATRELRHNLQRFGNLLDQAQVADLIKLAGTTDDPPLYQELAGVTGVLKPDPVTTGRRLRGYVIPPSHADSPAPEPATPAQP